MNTHKDANSVLMNRMADREGLTALRSVHAECARLLRRPQRAKVASAPGAFEFRCAQ